MHPQWTNFNFGGNKFWFSQIKFVSLVRSGPYAALHTSCFTPHLPVCFFFLRRCKPFPYDCFVSCMFPRHLERIFFVSWYLCIYFSRFIGQYIFVKFVFLFHKNLLLLHMLSRRIWVKRAQDYNARKQHQIGFISLRCFLCRCSRHHTFFMLENFDSSDCRKTLSFFISKNGLIGAPEREIHARFS